MRLLDGWLWLVAAWVLVGIDRVFIAPMPIPPILAIVGIACAVIGMVRGLRDYSKRRASKP